MAAPIDALSVLAPPPPSAEPIVDATIDAEKDPRHLRFEEIKKLPDTDPQKYISLSALIEEFIAAGHNPRAPTDIMFQILGVTPEFLEGLLFSLKGQAMQKQPLKVVKNVEPSQAPEAPAAAPENQVAFPEPEPVPDNS